tara:strand:+ start:1891 stop:2172 length:282 start_codon:yes stop_codon:yes gene_type:complete
MARRIIRTTGSSYVPPKRVAYRRKDGRLTEEQKWRKHLGKRGMFEFEATIVTEEVTRTKMIRTDSYDDALAWARIKCQEGMTIYIDGEEIVSR